MLSAFLSLAIQVAAASAADEPHDRPEPLLGRACAMLSPNGLIDWEQLITEDALLIHDVEQRLGGHSGPTRPGQQLVLALRCRLQNSERPPTRNAL